MHTSITGIQAIDAAIAIHPQVPLRMGLVMGQAGAGTSTGIINMAVANMRSGRPSLLITLDSPIEHVIERIVIANGGVLAEGSKLALNTGVCSYKDLEKVVKDWLGKRSVLEAAEGMSVYIDGLDMLSFSVAEESQVTQALANKEICREDQARMDGGAFATPRLRHVLQELAVLAFKYDVTVWTSIHELQCTGNCRGDLPKLHSCAPLQLADLALRLEIPDDKCMTRATTRKLTVVKARWPGIQGQYTYITVGKE